MTKTQPREGWWFSDHSGKLPNNDGREIVIGQKISVKGKLVMCQNALHGSFDAFDALQYAPGPVLNKVLFSGYRIEQADKLGSRSRTVIERRDATAMLLRFARGEALTVAHLWNMPDIVRQYLETGDVTLRDAARTAAEGAARYAAWSAADAAEGAAGAAARYAARAAARAAAWSAARSAARERFNRLVSELFAG